MISLGKRGMRYLKGSLDQVMFYGARPRGQEEGDADSLEVYSDASHMIDWERSQIGAVCLVNGGPIAWRTTVAPLAAGSTCESELQAATMGCQMAMGISTLMEDVGLSPKVWQGIDNQASLSVLQDTSSWRTRHLAIRSSVLRDLVKDGALRVQHVTSREQRADGLTKFLKADLHKHSLKGWSLFPAAAVHHDKEKNHHSSKHQGEENDSEAKEASTTSEGGTKNKKNEKGAKARRGKKP